MRKPAGSQAAASVELSPSSTLDGKYRRRWLTLLVLSISLLIINIDDTIVNIAIPTLQRVLGASVSELQWIVTAYILVFAGLLLTMGSLGDRFGRKIVLQLGLAIFGVSSVLAAYSAGSLQMILARAIMGLGAALIMPSTLSVIVDVFPQGERIKAIGIWTGVASLGLPLGPLLGGWLLQNYWWGSIFLINVPIVLAALVAGVLLVPESRNPSPLRMDLPGMAMSTLALAGLLYGIIGVPQLGWRDPTILAAFALAILFGASFVKHEQRTDHPMLDLGLFRNRSLSSGTTTLVMTFLAFAGLAFIVVQYLQIVRGFSPFEVGVLILPLIIAVMVGAGASSKLVARWGPRRTISLSLAILAAGMVLVSLFDTRTGFLTIAFSLVPVGFGLGSAMVPSTTAITEAVPKDNAGVGSSLNDIARQLGAALGVSVLGSFLSWAYSLNMGNAAARLSSGLSSTAVNSVGGASRVAGLLGNPARQLLLDASFRAFVDAFRVTSLVAAVMLAIAAFAIARSKFTGIERFMRPTIVATNAGAKILDSSTGRSLRNYSARNLGLEIAKYKEPSSQTGSRLSTSRVTVGLILSLAITMSVFAFPAAYAESESVTPRTWHVLVGGQSNHMAVQADAYYPHVITIDAGDKVIWTLNAAEPHSVTFFGTCQDFTDFSCFQQSLIPCLTSGALDFVPCSLPTYDGIGLASSGRMIQSGYNWDNSIPHGDTTYSLIFTNPGVDIYFDVSALGMRGIVVVNPAGTPYPFNQEQYSQQAQQELQSDLEAGAQTLDSFQPPVSTGGPANTQIHHISVGLNAPQIATATLKSPAGSRFRGTASLSGTVQGQAENITVQVNLTGLVPGSVHSVQILLGVCGAEAPTTTFLALPTFILNKITARADGRGCSTTVITSPPSSNGPAVLRIPSAGWIISIGTGSGLDTSPAACGNAVFHNVSVMRFLPRKLNVNVGDTIVWTDSPNGVHSVTFLAGQPLPLIPDYVFTSPTGNATTYDGSSFFDSGTLRPGDRFVLTLTKPGSYPYVDVFLAFLGMQGSIIVHADPLHEQQDTLQP